MIKGILIVTLTTFFVLWVDKRTEPWIRKVLQWFPAILFAYALPALVTHTTGWDLTQIGLHDISKNWIVPLAILCVMSALSFRQLKIVGTRPIVLFVEIDRIRYEVRDNVNNAKGCVQSFTLLDQLKHQDRPQIDQDIVEYENREE